METKRSIYPELGLRGIILLTIAFCFSTLVTPKETTAFPYKGFDIDLNARVSGVYDSNVNFGEDGDESFRIDGGIDLSVQRLLRRQSLKLVGSLGHGFYLESSKPKSGYESFTAEYYYEISEYMRVKVRDVFYHSTEPFSFEEELHRVRGRYDLNRNTFLIDLSRDISSHLFVNLAYQNVMVRREVFEDYDHNFVTIGLNYKPEADKIYYLSYTLGRSMPEGGTKSTSHSGRLGIQKYLTKRLDIKGSIGLDVRRYENGDENSSGVFELSARNEIDRLTTGSIRFFMGKSFLDEEGIYTDNWRISATLERVLTNKLNGSVELFYGESDYDNGVDKLTGIDGNLDYEIGKHIRSILGYSFSHFDSTVKDTTGYVRNVISLGIRYVF